MGFDGVRVVCFDSKFNLTRGTWINWSENVSKGPFVWIYPIKDFKIPDRVVVGTDSDRAREVMEELYRPLFLNQTPILFTARRTSELIKYAANAFLATKITFINEIAALCERTGADVKMVSKGMGLDNRIGNKFLHAGPGYGGSCFPKDIKALIKNKNGTIRFHL